MTNTNQSFIIDQSVSNKTLEEVLQKMPRSKEQFQKMQETSQEKILLSTLSLFVKNGTSVSMQQIAQHAGISKGLIYHYFKSKEDLIISLVRFGSDSSSMHTKNILDLELPASVLIQKTSEMMVATLQAEDITAHFFLFMVQLSVSAPSLMIQEALAQTRQPTLFLSDVIRRGQKEGSVVDGEPMILSHLYWAMVQGLCCFKLVGMPVSDIAPYLSRILLK